MRKRSQGYLQVATESDKLAAWHLRNCSELQNRAVLIIIERAI